MELRQQYRLIALIPALFSLFALIGAVKYAEKVGEFPFYMAANVAAAIVTPLLLGISVLLSGDLR
jgi:1,4-dihydroxy-2-naphthoate octaprenyltransferase